MPQSIIPNRISLRDALAYLAPLMSKSTFYGSPEQPGPRWTHIREVDIRDGGRVTLDRQKFFGWTRKLAGEHATRRSEIAERLRRLPTPGAEASCPDQALELLTAALKCGALTRADVEHAICDVELRWSEAL